MRACWRVVRGWSYARLAALRARLVGAWCVAGRMRGWSDARLVGCAAGRRLGRVTADRAVCEDLARRRHGALRYPCKQVQPASLAPSALLLPQTLSVIATALLL